MKKAKRSAPTLSKVFVPLGELAQQKKEIAPTSTQLHAIDTPDMALLHQRGAKMANHVIIGMQPTFARAQLLEMCV
ncbi:MAG: hypothetical protein AAGM46_26115 [Cyanobacteria bacterium J06582_2]